MALRVRNTRTHAVEPFVTREPGVVRMYVCGPSVYDEAHLGHARSYVAYDAMKRTLRAMGNRVLHVQNFTDVEEHVAERAARKGVAPLDFATALIGRFFEDMDALGVARADHYPRVSEHIPDILRIIEGLEDNGVAYRIDCGPRGHIQKGCDIYFSVEKSPGFGQLIGTTVDELTVERPEKAGDRRNPLDFALWKSRDDWGVTWRAPWGEGRPGWHVECAAMSTRYLGMGFDIHGGGMDLVFPHHESERAIAEALHGELYCNYYLHNGFVTVGEQKMSKSLGNFVTVKDMLARHDPEVVRTFLLEAHYRAPLNYDEATLARTAQRVQRWRDAVKRLHKEAEARDGPAPKARAAFWAALEDDFHFDRALDAIDDALAEEGDADGTLAFLREASRALGVLWAVERPAP